MLCGKSREETAEITEIIKEDIKNIIR